MELTSSSRALWIRRAGSPAARACAAARDSSFVSRAGVRRAVAVVGMLATLSTAVPHDVHAHDAGRSRGSVARGAAGVSRQGLQADSISSTVLPSLAGPSGPVSQRTVRGSPAVSSLDGAPGREGRFPAPSARSSSHASSVPSSARYATYVYSNGPPMAGVERLFKDAPGVDPAAVLSRHHAPITHHAVDRGSAVPDPSSLEPVAHGGAGRVLVDPASGHLHVAAGGDPSDPSTAPMLRRALVATYVDGALADSDRRDHAVPSAAERAAARHAVRPDPVVDRNRQGVSRARSIAGFARRVAGLAYGTRLGSAAYRGARMVELGAAVVDTSTTAPRATGARYRGTPVLGAAPDSTARVARSPVDRRVAIDLADYAVSYLSSRRDAWKHRGSSVADFKAVWNDPARRARVVSVADHAVSAVVERQRSPVRQDVVSSPAYRHMVRASGPAPISAAPVVLPSAAAAHAPPVRSRSSPLLSPLFRVNGGQAAPVPSICPVRPSIVTSAGSCVPSVSRPAR